MDNPVLWIIVAIVVILIIVAIVAMLNGKKKKEQQRQEAAQLREQAATQELQVKQREQEAEQAAQEAARRRADADRAAAEARQAEQAASQKQAGAQSVRGEYDDQHRQADLIDPDVDTDKDGFRTDGSRPGGDDAFGAADGPRDGVAHEERNDRNDGPGWGTAAAAGALGAGAAAHHTRDSDDRAGVLDDDRTGVRDDQRVADHGDSGLDLRDRDNDGDRFGDHDADAPVGAPAATSAGTSGGAYGISDPAAGPVDDSVDGPVVDDLGDRESTRTMGDVAGDAHHGGYDEQGDPQTHFGDGLAGNSPRGHDGDLPARPQEPGLAGRHSYNEGTGDHHHDVEGHQHEGSLDGRRSEAADGAVAGSAASPVFEQTRTEHTDAPVGAADEIGGGYADESTAGWNDSVDRPADGFDQAPSAQAGAGAPGAQSNWDAPPQQDRFGDQPQGGGFEQPQAGADGVRGEYPADDAQLPDGTDWHSHQGTPGVDDQAPVSPGAPADGGFGAPDQQFDGDRGFEGDRGFDGADRNPADASGGYPGVIDQEPAVGAADGTVNATGADTTGDPAGGAVDDSVGNAADNGSEHRSIGDRIRSLRDDMRGRDNDGA